MGYRECSVSELWGLQVHRDKWLPLHVEVEV